MTRVRGPVLGLTSELLSMGDPALSLEGAGSKLEQRLVNIECVWIISDLKSSKYWL